MASEEEDDAGTTDSHRLFRWRMPADDEVLEAFFAAQPRRGVGAALRQLCHMWVNTYGPVPVIDTVLTGAGFSDPGAVGFPAGPAGGTDSAETAAPAETVPSIPPATQATQTGRDEPVDPAAEQTEPTAGPRPQFRPLDQAPDPGPAESPAPAPAPAPAPSGSQSADDIFRGM